MDKNRAFLLWIAIAGGGFLLYSAYKGKSPTETLTAYANNGTAGKTDSGPSVTAPTVAGSDHVSSSFTSDSNGYTVEIPPAYKNSPGTFIPSASWLNNNG